MHRHLTMRANKGSTQVMCEDKSQRRWVYIQSTELAEGCERGHEALSHSSYREPLTSGWARTPTHT